MARISGGDPQEESGVVVVGELPLQMSANQCSVYRNWD